MWPRHFLLCESLFNDPPVEGHNITTRVRFSLKILTGRGLVVIYGSHIFFCKGLFYFESESHDSMTGIVKFSLSLLVLKKFMTGSFFYCLWGIS